MITKKPRKLLQINQTQEAIANICENCSHLSDLARAIDGLKKGANANDFNIKALERDYQTMLEDLKSDCQILLNDMGKEAHLFTRGGAVYEITLNGVRPRNYYKN